LIQKYTNIFNNSSVFSKNNVNIYFH
jgi:hypothetical protein